MSDDEDDTHPNIDTPSLFRWRHQARVERMQQAEQEKKQFEEEKAKYGHSFSSLVFINIYLKLNSVLKTNCTILKFKNRIKS